MRRFITFTNLAGQKVQADIRKVIDGMREGTHYYDQNTPRRSWTLSGSKGLQMTQTIDNDNVDFTWVYAYPEYLGQLETEVWAKRRTLQPGESFTYTQDLEIKPVE